MHNPDHPRLMRPPTWQYSYFFFSEAMLVGLQIKVSQIAEAPLYVPGYKVRNKQTEIRYFLFLVLFIFFFFFFSIFVFCF